MSAVVVPAAAGWKWYRTEEGSAEVVPVGNGAGAKRFRFRSEEVPFG